MWQEEMVDRLKQAPRDQRPRIMAAYRNMTGMSTQHLYRIAKQYGFTTGRTGRADKGLRKSGITVNQVKLVAGLLHTTAREIKGPIMPVDRALEIAEDNGYIDEGQITPSRLRAILKEEQMNKSALSAQEPHISMRSLHPNHAHVFDVSVCIQFYLKGNKGLQIMDERDFYKNKLHNVAKVKTRILRYVIVDHFSGMFYFRYYDAAGESADNLYRFLVEAWREKSDLRFPFRGVPFHLIMDAGSANTSRPVIAFLSRLGVSTPEGRPYNSKRQGSVEVTHNIIEGRFESCLRLQPAHDIETLNAWAFDFCIKHNATHKHSRHGMTRTQAWLLIKPEQLRELPEDSLLLELFTYTDETFTRVVNRDYTISYKGDSYNLKHIERIVPGISRVRIIIKPYDQDTIGVVFNDVVYDVRAIKTLPAELGAFPVNSAIIGEEYKSQPDSVTQRAIKDMENMAYGEERKKGQVPFAGLRVFGNQAEKVDLALIPKRGTPMEVERPNGESRMSFVEFLKKLTQRVGAISKEQNRLLQETFGATIDKAKAEEVIRQFEEDGYEHVGRGTWGVKDTEVANQ